MKWFLVILTVPGIALMLVCALLMLVICFVVQMVWLPFGVVLKLCGARVKVFYPLVWWWYSFVAGLPQEYRKYFWFFVPGICALQMSVKDSSPGPTEPPRCP